MTDLKDLKAQYKRLGEEIDRLENPPEIPWDKIPAGTVIECADSGGWHARVFERYIDRALSPFIANTNLSYRKARPAKMPWIIYQGGGQPVADEQEVYVCLRDGSDFIEHFRRAIDYTWECDGADNDIIAYKVKTRD
jgi:hypothetical protein